MWTVENRGSYVLSASNVDPSQSGNINELERRSASNRRADQQ